MTARERFVSFVGDPVVISSMDDDDIGVQREGTHTGGPAGMAGANEALHWPNGESIIIMHAVLRVKRG